MPNEIDRRLIEVTFSLSQGGFGSGGSDTVSLTNHRVVCDIMNAGLQTGSMASVSIFGMSLSLMNRLSVIITSLAQQSPNTITITAGDKTSGLKQVFKGAVTEAFVDFQGSPDVAFRVTAMANSVIAALPISPTSYVGSPNASDVLQAIASKCGLQFVNNGVKSKLSPPVYFSGDGMTQITKCAASLGIPFVIDNGSLYIWPSSVSNIEPTFVVSGANGMIGYPQYNSSGVIVTTLFNPNAVFHQSFKLESDFAPAAWNNQEGQLNTGGVQVYSPSNGTWVIYNLQHSISCNMPDGPWFTTLMASRPDFAGLAY